MRRWAIRLAALACVLFFAAAALVPLPAKTRPTALMIEANNGSPLRAFASPDGGFWRFASKQHALPDHLRAAVLTFEDQRFYSHPGVDPVALLRALFQNISAGHVVSGGSTLTMQIARMIDPQKRTLSAKLLEAFRAVQLELRYDKEELLRNYLDLAPYGGNIEGVVAAARFYFDKDVSLLTLDEAATLAALPNSPARLSTSLPQLRARRDDVLQRMASSGAITEEQAAQAITVPLQLTRKSAPKLAPHLSEKLRQAHPEADTVRSSIDPVLQKRAEDLLTQQHRLLMRNNITSGAVVIIENSTRKIRALAGSPNFFDSALSGQVDGSSALRSPGSALKPFVYALAFDRGIASPSTALEDVPLMFKDWAPENFDGNYRGLVSAEDALRASLNIPAVELSKALGRDGLIALLQRANFTQFQKDPARHGLSVVLGGCEVTLLELTNLYATLASGGKHRPPSFLEKVDSTSEETQLFSEGAAYLVTEILSGVRRPELPDSWKDSATIPQVSWKTGTSYGRRDAWTIGYDRRYTVGVWVGHHDGRGVPELIGVQAAAPLFFALFETLGGAPWFERPLVVREREVCALSGAPAGPACAHKRSELALENAPSATCALHQRFEIDDATGYRLCSKCRAGRARHMETHVAWPPRTAAFFASTGAKEDPIPVHDPACVAKSGRGGPMIAFPLPDDEFLLRDGVSAELQKIVFRSAAEGGAGRLYWFVDGVLIDSAPAGVAVEWTPVLGPHRIALVDEEGESAAIEIRIRHSAMLISP